MNPVRSIAMRLAALFALAALGVFTLIGVALHRVFTEAIDAHQQEQLDTKFQDIEYMIRRVREPEQWLRVHAKLDALTPPDDSTRFWIWSDDPVVQYGASRAEIAGISGASGRGQVTIENRPTPMRTRAEYFPAEGSRPALRFMVGIDPEPYVRTARAFEQALFAWSALGVVLVALLGYWAARLGLRPLRRLCEEARQISPTKRSQRLDAGALPMELSDLGRSFNGALDRLEAAYDRLEAFNADVTHELRTPLANLIGQTQVALSRGRSSAELEETLQSNLEEFERLRSIIADMLFLARADQGEKAMSLSPASLSEEVRKTVAFVDLITDEAGVTVRVEGDAHAPVERSLFRRAVTNLLHNAIRHTAADAEIVVRLTETETDARIAISNPGPGIADEHLGRIFDRFYRIDTARSNSGEHHGLGLSIVKAVASMHAGTVFASSHDGMTTVGFSVARGAGGAR